jgi:hypothetical protein
VEFSFDGYVGMITTWPENRFGTRIEYPTFAGDVVSGAGMTG